MIHGLKKQKTKQNASFYLFIIILFEPTSTLVSWCVFLNGIRTFVGYFIPNPVLYIYIIYDLKRIVCKQHYLIQMMLSFVNTNNSKWFQILLSNTNSSICIQLNGFKFCQS